jgi:hypothetical protein
MVTDTRDVLFHWLFASVLIFLLLRAFVPIDDDE